MFPFPSSRHSRYTEILNAIVPSRNHALISSTRMLLLLSLLTIEPVAVRADDGERGGREQGHVLPPEARPHGYSLDRMVSLLALFQTSGNKLSYYPFEQFPESTRPFQVLYLPNQVSNHFVVYPGTVFYVPLVFVDDSLPILGSFPIDAKGAEYYFTSPHQLGGKNWRIIVDRDTNSIGAEYFAGSRGSNKSAVIRRWRNTYLHSWRVCDAPSVGSSYYHGTR
jgi:hypothetical protein